MDVCQSLITDPQSAELMQPSKGAFDDPTVRTESTAIGCVAFGENRLDVPFAQLIAVGLRVVPAVALHAVRSSAGSARLATDRRNAIYQWKQLRDVMGVGAGDNGRQGNALGVGDYMVLAARFAPVGGVRARFLPPPMARTDALSTTARDQSIWSALRSLANITSWMRCQTPASCHARSRRQQVIPEPHPISWGKYSQGMPVIRTNRIPLNTLRLSNGLRPGYRFRRGFAAGRSGSISFQRSSSRIGLAMSSPPAGCPKHGHRTVFLKT